tara:strand:+ start:106 stop:375 length:270 start_codon:yes stop_codon:yes gene_type:complete
MSIPTRVKYAIYSAYKWLFPIEDEVVAKVERVDINRYKIVIHFPERDVAIQFKRPRGPLEDPLDNVRKEILPYLQNDRKTPIKIYENVQ